MQIIWDEDQTQSAQASIVWDDEPKGQDPSVGGVIADLAKQPFYAMRGMNIAARQALGDVFGSERMQKSAQDEAKEMEYQQKAYSPQFESETAQGLYSGAQSLARQAPAVALGIATGGLAAPLVILGADTGGGAYTKYRGRGATPGMAAVGALGEGGIEIVTELMPMGFLLKKFGKVGLGQFLTGMLAREIPSEQAATLVQDAIDTAIANPNKTWAEYVKERPGAAYQTLLATVAQGGLMAAGSKAASKFIPQPKTAEDVKNNLDTIDVKNADHEEAIKVQSPTTMYVGKDGIASDTLGTQVKEEPAVTEYAQGQVQDRLGETAPEKYSYWEPNQQEMFPPISGPHFPDAKSAGQQDLGLTTGPGGVPPIPPTGGPPGAATYNEGDAGVTPVKSTVASDAQANAIWYRMEASKFRRAGDEARAAEMEAKAAQQDKIFEQASKEYNKPIAEGNDGGFRTDTSEIDRNLPDYLNQIEAAGTFLTDEDYVKAMARKIARNPEKFTNVQKAEMMQNPRKFLKPDIVSKELGLTGPANTTKMDPTKFKSYNEKTGEFSGIEAFESLINDDKYRGYKLIMKYIIKHMKKQEASGVPLKFALDRYDDGTLRELTWDRGLKEKGHNFGAAHYDSTNNLIWFAKRGLSPRDFIHEAIHGLTARFVNSHPNDPRVKALQFIFESVKKDPIFQKSENNEPEYGLTNLKEFLSEAFSHPRFQNKLLSHKVAGLSGTVKSAMSALAEQVRRILGVPDTKATNTLEEIMLRMDPIVEEQSKWSPKDQAEYKKGYLPSQGLVILPLYVKQMEHQAKLKAAIAEQKRKNEWEALRDDLEKMINGSSKANQEMSKLAQSDRTVDKEDAKAGVIEDVTGIQHVAKDPVVDDALIEKIQKEEDGSPLWAFTPGALARAITAKSTLVLTGYRLMDNAAKRIAFKTERIIAPVEKAVVKILQSDKKAEIMHDLFMRELRNKRDYTPEELRGAGVSEDIIMAHLEFRAMMEGVREQQNIALADKGLPPVDRLESFITSRWSGPWRANIRDADGNIVWQIAEQSRKKANQALEYIMARETGLKADDILYRQGMERSNSVEAGYQEMLKLVDPEDPRTQVLQSIYKEYILGKTEDVAQQEKHFLRKTGVRGYAGDRPWSKEDAKDMFVQQFEYAKNAIKWAEYQKAVDKIKPLLREPSIQESQKNNIAYLKEYSKNHLGFGTHELFSKLDNTVAKFLGISPDSLQSGMGAAKTYFYLSRLGLSIPFTITQFIQPAVTTPGWHTQLSSEGYWHNPITTAVMGTVNGIGASMYHYIKMLGGDTTFVTDLMDGVDKDAVRWMEANGIVEINQLVDIKRDLRPEAVKIAAAPFEFTIKHSETIARSMAFMAFVTHLKQSGKFDLDSAKGRAELFQKAEDMTKISMTDYRPTERAMVFERGGLTGDAAATLHSYQINNLFQMWNFAKEFKNGNPMPLVNMMFMQFLAAGMMGMWFIDDLDDLWENFKKFLSHEDYMKVKDKSIKNFILQHGNDFLAYGLVSKIGGTNMHTRMTAADQLPIWPFEPADLTSAKGVGKTVLDTIGNAVPFAGTAGNTLAAPVQAIRNIPERDKWEAAYAGAPAIAQGPMENLPAFNAGKVSKSPQDLNRGTYRRTEEEKNLRNLGLRSTKEQRYKDKDYQNSKIEKEMQRRMQNAHERAVSYFLDGNNKMGVTEAIKYVELGGEASTVLQSVPKARIREATTELDRRAIEAGSGTKASILKLKRYLDNVQ